MLTLTKKRGMNLLPICKIQGGKNDGKILYLNIDPINIKGNLLKEKEETIPKSLIKPKCEYCKRKFYANQDLKRHQAKSCYVFKNYKKENKNKYSPGSMFNEFIVEDGILQQLPNQNDRDILYICGPTGCGKSHYTRKYLEEFNEMYPDKDVFLFSRLDKDTQLDTLPELRRIIVNNELVENPIDCKKELMNSVCVFDDIDSIQDKKTSISTNKLVDDILLTGRDQEKSGDDIFVIYTSHQIVDFQRTRNILNECSHIILFPQSSGIYQITKALKMYFGFNQRQINKILKEPSRWVCIHHKYPNYILTQNKCYLLNNIE